MPSIRKTERTETACSKQNPQGIHSTEPNKSSSNGKPEGCGRNKARECKLSRARTWGRKTLPPKLETPLQNHFVALQTEEALDVDYPELFTVDFSKAFDTISYSIRLLAAHGFDKSNLFWTKN